MDNNNRNGIIIAILLLILILILIFFSHYGELRHDGERVLPTGKVDIFDINVYINYFNYTKDKDGNVVNVEKILGPVVLGEKDEEGEKRQEEDPSDNKPEDGKKEDDDQKPTYTDEDGKPLPYFEDDISDKVKGTVYVDDKNGNYIYQNTLKIFENAAYEYTNKIAPGVSNVYQFVVHNGTNAKIKYYMKMYEESEYKINMKYRLKRGDQYVVGDANNWVSASELQTRFKEMKKGSSDSYSLEWKWFDDDVNDTIAGENMTSEYKLTARFYFEAIK